MATKPTERPRNYWLIKFRQWHTWLGVGAGALFVAIALTGIFLNHKDFFLAWFTSPADKAAEAPSAAEPAPFTSAAPLAGLAISFERAAHIANQHLGQDVALDKIELKREHGELIYRVKTHKELSGIDKEVLISASTGQITTRNPGGYRKETQKAASAPVQKGYDWGKLMKDIHTGKVGGPAGQFVADAVALILVFLTGSGVWLWATVLWRKRQSSASRITACEAARQPDRRIELVSR